MPRCQHGAERWLIQQPCSGRPQAGTWLAGVAGADALDTAAEQRCRPACKHTHLVSTLCCRYRQPTCLALVALPPKPWPPKHTHLISTGGCGYRRMASLMTRVV